MPPNTAPAGSTIDVNARVHGRGSRRPGSRSRPRNRAGRLAAPVRAVLPRRGGKGARVRHRAWASDRARTAGGGTGSHLGRELSRRRRAVHHHGSGRGQGIRTGSLANHMTQEARILLVDDEVSIQRAVGPLLRSRGYEVDIAGTGTEALKIVAERTPDLIVLDLGLPDLEGTEVCRRIRATSKVPIVVLSARGAEADKVNALDLGADDYVTKPFGPEELLARIRVALRRVMSEDEAETGHVPRRGPHDRLRPAARPPARDGDPADAQGIRAPVAAGAQSRSRADASRHPEGHLGTERGGTDRNTCGRWWPSFARRSNRIRPSRGISSANPGSAIGSPRVTQEQANEPCCRPCAPPAADLVALLESGLSSISAKGRGTPHPERLQATFQDSGLLRNSLAPSQAGPPTVEARSSQS